MNKLLRFTAIVVLVMGSAVALRAEDPLKVAPDMYSLIYENNRVRVMQVVFKPGQSIAKHSHPDHFVYVLEGGKLNISHPDGTSGDNDLKVGQVIWIPAETHWAKNVGPTQIRLLVSELKEGAPKAAAAK